MTDQRRLDGDAPQSRAIMTARSALNFGIHLGLTDWLELALDHPRLGAELHRRLRRPTARPADPTHRAHRLLRRPSAHQRAAARRRAARRAARLQGAHRSARACSAWPLPPVVTLPFGDDSAFLGDSGFTFRPTLIADFTRGPITAAVNVGAIIRAETVGLDPYDVAAEIADAAAAHRRRRRAHLVGRRRLPLRALGRASPREVYGSSRCVDAATADAPRTTPPTCSAASILPDQAIWPSRVGAGAGVLASARCATTTSASSSASPGRRSRRQGRRSPPAASTPTATASPTRRTSARTSPRTRTASRTRTAAPIPTTTATASPTSADKCPNEPEDKDGFQDDDGCPSSTTTATASPTRRTSARTSPRTRTASRTTTAAPIPTTTATASPTPDKCPNEPETRNGVDDDDGCPDSGGQVAIAGGKIELPEQIQFETGKATHRRAARRRCSIASPSKLKANPQVKRIRIEGHTDDVGERQARTRSCRRRAPRRCATT